MVEIEILFIFFPFTIRNKQRNKRVNLCMKGQTCLQNREFGKTTTSGKEPKSLSIKKKGIALKFPKLDTKFPDLELRDLNIFG